MNINSLEYYVRKLNRLNVDRSKGSPAPHKPVLLLSIIQSIECNEILENRIYITSTLVARFKDNWHQLVKNSKFTSNFSLPFYHLQSEKFWFLKTLIGREIQLTNSRSIKSFSHLREVVDYAFLDQALFDYLIESTSRQILKETLLKTYFHIYSYPSEVEISLVAEIKNEMLEETPSLYKTKAETFDDEEVFIRSGIFKKIVPQIYNYSCCISAMRIIATREVQMIDACHIVPFSDSHDDTISNGISLCPNLHRAFDRGLISIDQNYRVIVSESFSESEKDYSIRNFSGKQILLPIHKKYLPSLENLSWHQMNIFK
jgi:putative restriction endonuclease